MKHAKIKQIEEEFGFQIPLDISKFYELAILESEANYIFNTRSVGHHWLLNADYFFIKPDEINTRDRGKFFINDYFVEENESVFESVNRTMSESIREHWLEEKVLAFAWSNDVVEKDCALVYIFDAAGNVKGVYAHSLNFIEEKVFVAKSLSDVFDLENLDVDTTEFYVKPNKKGSTPSFNDVLRTNYVLIDLESVDDIKDYKTLFEKLSLMSGQRFSFTTKHWREQNQIRFLDLEISGVRYDVEVDGNTDFIDLRIIDFMNQSFQDSGYLRKKFVAFEEASFGQEIGIAFITQSKLEALKKLEGIKVIKG